MADLALPPSKGGSVGTGHRLCSGTYGIFDMLEYLIFLGAKAQKSRQGSLRSRKSSPNRGAQCIAEYYIGRSMRELLTDTGGKRHMGDWSQRGIG
jgi:hypothetical protein